MTEEQTASSPSLSICLYLIIDFFKCHFRKSAGFSKCAYLMI